MQERILERLIDAFPDFSFIEVKDFSSSHREHFSVDKDNQSHFFLSLEDKAFCNMTHLERHKKVNRVLKDLVKDIHALQMQLHCSE